MSVIVRVGADASSAAAIAAGIVAQRIRSAVAARGAATAAFSGGTTPAVMLRRLAALDVPWERLTVFQVDERVAPDGDPDRNLELLGVLPLPARAVVAMPVTTRDLRAAARRYAARLPARLDVVHLGLGADGHTASWLPGDDLSDSPRRVEVSAPYAGRMRMTLTAVAVNAARSRVVLVTGADKRDALHRWLTGDRSLPVARVRRTATVVVADEAAAPGTARQ